jgi:hypothetical protein
MVGSIILFIYTIENKLKTMKKKKKIGLSINKEVLEKIDKLTTNKSRLIELILLDYLTKNGIETNDIIL